jgi:hypothetical protein
MWKYIYETKNRIILSKARFSQCTVCSHKTAVRIHFLTQRKSVFVIIKFFKDSPHPYSLHQLIHPDYRQCCYIKMIKYCIFTEYTQCNCYKIRQKFPVKNLPNLFGVRNPRNCMLVLTRAAVGQPGGYGRCLFSFVIPLSLINIKKVKLNLKGSVK